MPSELFVSRLGRQTWAALREDGSTAEFHVETSTERPRLGRIIKGRVSNILPGIQSAFVDIGDQRGGFLHNSDVVLPGEASRTALGDSSDGEFPDLPRPTIPIEDRLKVGRELLVQVSREGAGSKGARVTCLISIPGRFTVLSPYVAQRGVSRRIRDAAERARLEAVLSRLPGGDVGFVGRTAADGVHEEELLADAESLLAAWKQILADAGRAGVPGVVYREPPLLLRLLRDLPRRGLERIVVDDAEHMRIAVDYLLQADPELASRVSLRAGESSLPNAYRLVRELRGSLRPKVWLESGGYVVIEETEALISIDVNTGKYRGAKDLEETALKTNLEAAVEIARQLRLRDLGGIVVIDFIDMDREANRSRVITELEQALQNDRARSRVIGLSELGLLQLTRKRQRLGTAGSLTAGCPRCDGSGRVKGARMVSAETMLELRRLAGSPASRLVLRAHPEVIHELRADIAAEREAGAELPAAQIVLERDDTLLPQGVDIAIESS